MALIYCPECGNQTSDQAVACNKCGYPISKLNFSQTVVNETKSQQQSKPKNNFDGLDYSYQQEFEEIQKSNEEYRGRFNWYAFLFSWIWLLTKGAWGWALVVFISNLLVNVFFSIAIKSELRFLFMFASGLGIAITLGHNATKIYYNVRVKNKQF